MNIKIKKYMIVNLSRHPVFSTLDVEDGI